MTDLKLNLKAGNLKKFLAMFMAVCLTVLSVNVPVNAAEEQKVVDFDETSFKVEFASALDGEVSQYNGTVKVDVENVKGSTVELKDKPTVVSAVNGEIKAQEINLTISANELNVEKETTFDLSFSIEKDGKDEKQFAQSYVVIQRAKPVNEKEIANDTKNPVVVVSAVDGGDTEVIIEPDEALREDYYSNDVVGIVTDLDSRGKVYVKKNTNYVTVTVLDGKTVKTDRTAGSYTPYNAKTNDGVVAVYQKAANSPFTMTAKMKAVATNYFEKDGVEQAFAEFVEADPVSKGNKILGYKAKENGRVFKDTMPDKGGYVIATWKDAEIAENNADITVAVKKSASAQVLPEDTKDQSIKKFLFTVDVKGIGSNEGDSKRKLTRAQKDVISSVKYNAKTDVFTVKAGKKPGSATVKIVDKTNVNKVIAEVSVEVVNQKITSAYDALTIQTTGGSKSVYLDKNTAAKTAQLIALPGNTGVKYVATTKEVDVKTQLFETTDNKAAKLANTEIKKFTKDGRTSIKSKAISVAKTGKITAKKAVDDTQYVYAYQLVKYDKNKVKLVVSNVVKVDVTATARGLSLKKNTVKKFNNTAKDAYENKKTKEEQIKFTTKTKGESTDKIAILAINGDGKVVLGGKNGLKSVKKNEKPVAGQYYVGVAAKGDSKGWDKKTSADNLIIVATSPAGEQKYATLTYQK